MFLSEAGVVKLGDFGLAVQLEHSLSKRTTACGTSLYMAPEVYQKNGELKSDVWSLGITVIEMAEGKNPYDGLSPYEVMHHVFFMSPPTLSSPGWSSDLVDFVSKCLVREPEKRASVNELMEVSVRSESYE